MYQNIGADPTVCLDYGEFSYKTPYEVANHSAIQAFHVYLFEQIALGNSYIIDDLVSSGVPVDLADDSEAADSTLHWCVSFDNLNAAEVLLNLGISVNIVNKERKTCLHLACMSSNKNFVELLLNWGADVSLQDCDGKTAADYLSEDDVDLKTLLDTPVENVLMSPKRFMDESRGEKSDVMESPDRDTSAERNDGIAKHEQNNDSNDSYVLLEKTERPQSCESGSSKSNSGEQIPSDNSAYGVERDEVTSTGSSNVESASPQLVLWPPVQRQYHNNNEGPLIIDLSKALIISCDNQNIAQLLMTTRLINTLNGVGVETDVRATGKRGGANIWLSIDQNICPTRQSFDLHIDFQSIRLIASDMTGLLYAINTFVQILKLHSDYITNPTTNGEDALIVNYIKIPSMDIHDWPDIPHRGVLWCHSRGIRSKMEFMKDFLIYLSEVRLNQLFLSLNPDFEHDDKNISEVDTAVDYVHDDYALDLIKIDELSQQYCVDLIPTIILSSFQHKIPSIVLEKKFRYSLFAIIFDFDCDNEEVTSESLAQFLRDTYDQISSAGFSSVILSFPDWMIARDPTRQATECGLNTITYPLEYFYADLPNCRCVLSTKSYAKSLLHRAKGLLNVSRNSVTMLPLMNTADFYYPTILLKHLCFLHAGASWNYEYLEDILGSKLEDHTLLRPALSTMLFQTYNPNEADPENVEELHQSVLLDIFTENIADADEELHLSPSFSSDVHLHGSRSHVTPEHPIAIRSTASIETALWSLIADIEYYPKMPMPISKDEAIFMLKKTKRILALANWKSKKSKATKLPSDVLLENISSIETEEYMRMLNLINTVCRTIVMAYNSAQKPNLPYQLVNPSSKANDSNIFDYMMDALSPGTSSDLANAILESMSLCGPVWKLKYDAQFFTTTTSYHSGDDMTQELHEMVHQRYVRSCRAHLPLLTVFGAICKHMPTFSPEVLMKIFDDSDDTVESKSTALKEIASNGWSLWG